MKINCGLQDRVVQVYEGLVCMDFAQDLLEGRGYGEYTRMDTAVLPSQLFFLAFSMEPSDSGVIHSTVKERWANGDEYVVNAMAKFGGFAKGEDGMG
jgi:glucuronokinase